MKSVEHIPTKTPQGLDREGKDYEIEKIDAIETSQGSVYKYLSDGTTQRFKKTESKEFKPQDLMVYIPDFDYIRARTEWSSLVERFENDEHLYNQTLLKTTHGEGDAYVVDFDFNPPKILQTNEEVRAGKKVSLVCIFRDGTPRLSIPISPKPLIGFMTYDERTFTGDDGKSYRENHIGNKVTKIALKHT
jgi:hypothetical protein